MDVILRGLVFISLAIFVLPATAKNAGGAPKLMEYYDFIRLPYKAQVTYIREIRALMTEIEKEQTLKGGEYGQMDNRSPFFGWLIDVAEAAGTAPDERKKGTPCVYAGFITQYTANNKLTCGRPPKCTSGDGIQCNPILFGDKCTSPGDGATQRCGTPLPSDEVMIQYLTKPTSVKEWADFKAQFDAFCPDSIKAGSYEKDANYNSCRRVRDRMAKIQTLMDGIKRETPPPVAKEVEGPPSERSGPITPISQPPAQEVTAPPEGVAACGSIGSPGSACAQANCDPQDPKCGKLTCPTYAQNNSTPVSWKEFEPTHYGQLMKTMAHNCGIVSTFDNAVDLRLSQMGGGCRSLEYPRQDGQLESGESRILDRMMKTGSFEKENGDKKDPSEVFLKYYGLNQQEARQIFCDNVDVRNAFGLKMPTKPKEGFWQSRESFIRELRNYNTEKTQRNMLLTCLAANREFPSRGLNPQYNAVARSCKLYSYKLDASQFKDEFFRLMANSSGACLEQESDGKTNAWLVKGCYRKPGTTEAACPEINATGTAFKLEGSFTLRTLLCEAAPATTMPGSGQQVPAKGAIH